MSRRRFLTALSLSLWLGSIMLGAWSIRYPVATDFYRAPYHNGEWAVGLVERCIVLRVEPYPRVCPVFVVTNVTGSAIAIPAEEEIRPLPGLAWRSQFFPPTTSMPSKQLVARQVSVNCGWAFAVFGVLALRRFSLLHRPHQRDATSCGSCGYNLAGNISGVCPECGTPIPSGRAA